MEGALLESLHHFPVVLLIGPRQVGKSTLVREICRSAWPATYLTLDDRTTLDAALTDPDGLVQGQPGPTVIDEVQRAPDLLRAVKLEVDRHRAPGRFLLTGSAHVLTLASVSETLAGRVAVHELRPFAWSEMQRTQPLSISELFRSGRPEKLLRRSKAAGGTAELQRVVLSGGFPDPALMTSRRARSTWFESYRQTVLERDLRDIANVSLVPELGRLMVAIALRSGALLNVAELARDLGLSESTTRRHIQLLRQTFQVETLAPFASNRFKRLVKSPKIYWTDSGVAAHLAAVTTWHDLERRNMAGAMLETWVHAELRKLLSLEPDRMEISFWRSREGHEVDFLLERGGESIGIEVKSSAAIRDRDLAGLRRCRDLLGRQWRLAIMLYMGSDLVTVDRSTIAIPASRFFSGS